MPRLRAAWRQSSLNCSAARSPHDAISFILSRTTGSMQIGFGFRYRLNGYSPSVISAFGVILVRCCSMRYSGNLYSSVLYNSARNTIF